MTGRMGLIVASLVALSTQAWAATVETPHCHSMQVLGIGLVGGLENTGDDFGKNPISNQVVEGMLDRLGVEDFKINPSKRKIAAVMVTAQVSFCGMPGQPLVPYSRAPVDIQVTAMANATSLEHGVLLPTSLQGPDNQIYALGSGPVTLCRTNVPAAAPYACVVAGGRVRQPSDP